MIYLGKDPVGISNPKLSFPDNVRIASFTLENDVTSDVSIPNPFGSAYFKKIICIRFATDAVANEVIGFFANFTANRDSYGNRKLIVASDDGIMTSNYFPLIAFTNSTLTLRGNAGGIYKAGTYYIFAWDEVTNNA